MHSVSQKINQESIKRKKWQFLKLTVIQLRCFCLGGVHSPVPLICRCELHPNIILHLTESAFCQITNHQTQITENLALINHWMHYPTSPKHNPPKNKTSIHIFLAGGKPPCTPILGGSIPMPPHNIYTNSKIAQQWGKGKVPFPTIP